MFDRLGVSLQRRRSPITATRFDCGSAGSLTAREIIELTGHKTVYARIDRGWRGSLLVSKRQPSRQPGLPRTNSMLLACQLGIATAHVDRLLTVREIRSIRPMSRQAAERWRCALRAAMPGIKRYAEAMEEG